MPSEKQEGRQYDVRLTERQGKTSKLGGVYKRKTHGRFPFKRTNKRKLEQKHQT